MARYLDPKGDVVFKKIFSQHPHLLKSFLNALLPLPENGLIESLEYLHPEQIPEIPALKRPIIDVKCKDTQGRIFIVEMQIEWIDSFKQRLLFNSSKAFVKQLQKGEQYHLLNPVYGLGILASIFDKDSEDWYHHYKIVNVEKPERVIEGLQLVFIELPKFKPVNISQKKLQVLWLRFMKEINEKTRVIEPDLLNVPEIREAISLTEEAAYTPAELEAYDKYWDSVSTEKTLWIGRHAEGKAEGRVEGREEGIAEGIAKGIRSEKVSLAKTLQTEGFVLEKISQLTGLPSEELKDLIVND